MEDKEFGSHYSNEDGFDEIEQIKKLAKDKKANIISVSRLYDVLLLFEIMNSPESFAAKLKTYNNGIDKLNEMTNIFIETDELEKCSRIKRWKEIII